MDLKYRYRPDDIPERRKIITKSWTWTEKNCMLWEARQRKVLTGSPACPQGEDEVTPGDLYVFCRCLVIGLVATFSLKT